MNNVIMATKRAALGFTSFRDGRIRSLLYAGKLNGDPLATVTPASGPRSEVSLNRLDAAIANSSLVHDVPHYPASS
jgi:hypothetical protein